MAFVTLAIFLLLVAALWPATLVFFMARHLLRPRRMTDGRALARVGRMTPADLDLAFTPMGFTVRDARSNGPIRLAAWWLPAPAPTDRTVVVAHGYGDAKIGGIAWAPTWHALGWHVLAVDLRAHGESEGDATTAGFFERDDLDQILDALRAEKPAMTTAVALFGVSLGAACVAATAARRDDLAAVVLESPFADYRRAVRAHVWRAGFPLVSLSAAICRVAEWISGADFDAVRPAKLIPTIAAPVLAILSDVDPLVEPAKIVAAMERRPDGSIGEIVVLPGVRHIMGLAADPDGYRERIEKFLARAANAHCVRG